jgi:hypothetical protein
MTYPAPYKPKPGSPASRAVELLRFLPAGTALCAPELRKRAQIEDAGSLHIHLQKATRHRLLRAQKREDGDRLRTYWMDGRGDAVWADADFSST